MRETSAPKEGWSVVVPYFNEKNFLAATLASLAAQTLPPARLILVDNASTDRSRAVAGDFGRTHPAIAISFLSEPVPGKVRALKSGIEAVDTEFVALCDADTLYPPKYLERAAALFAARPQTAAVLAFGEYEGATALARAMLRLKWAISAALMPRQAHSGGFGQAFRTSVLKQVGGYSKDRWPYMVADHEIIHCVGKLGGIAYSPAHFCVTSDRRLDRRRVDWTLAERLAYHLVPHSRKDWFFYEFLATRFERRGLYNANLRVRDWEAESA